MKIVNVDSKIKERLKESKLSDEMSNLLACDFLVIVEHNKKIIGASGIGGKFHVRTLIVQDKFRNKGLGILLLKAVIEEAKKRKYSFVIASRDPNNPTLVRVHDFLNLMPIFQVQYREKFTRDVLFLSFNKKGEVFRKLLSFFNTKIGTTVLIIFIKILKKILFNFLLTYSPEEFTEPDIRFAITNFKKINRKHR